MGIFNRKTDKSSKDQGVPAIPVLKKLFSRRGAQPAESATSKPSVVGSVGTIVASDGVVTTRVEFKIQHWVKGRLRILIPRLAEDEIYSERLRYEISSTNSGFTVRINPKAKSLVIEYDPAKAQAEDVLDQIIVCIKSAAKPGVMSMEPLPEEPKADAHEINYVNRLGLAGLSLAMVAGTAVGVMVPPLLLGATLIAAAVPSYKRAWAALRDEKKLNVDFLDSTAITLLTATGMFFPPALMVTLIESGEIIRDLTARRSARAKLDLLDSLGRVARIERDGVEVEVPLEQVVAGDVVVVYPGDQIPVDGTVLSGIGLVDQHKLTGESVPVTRETGQDVLAATLVVDGTMRIETKRTGNNTRAGVVVALMESAPVHDTRMEDYARKVGDRIVVPTLALGAATTVMSAGNIVRGVSVITFDVGTGVRVSVPTAILASLTFAARNGILMRSGRGLEQMAGIDAVVFDKTGTLTQGKAGVVGIYIENNRSTPTEVLQLAATAEQGLTHPVAEAITRHARESNVPLKECEEWEFQVGKGVVARIDGRKVFVGSHRMMTGLGVNTQRILDANPDITASAASQVYVADEAGLLGVILYKDPARPESKMVISLLKEMGITPYMLSGDMKNVANAIAAELGIEPENVYAEAFPERKVEVVKQLQDSGRKIAFVGDGINDSAALAHASASVSFAGATDMARETADVVLMDDNLLSLIMAIKISRHAMNVVNQNAAIVVGPNLGGMIWAALIGVSPTIAVLINNGSAIVAEMNGFRPLMGPPGWQQLKAEQDAIVLNAKKPASQMIVEAPAETAQSAAAESTPVAESAPVVEAISDAPAFEAVAAPTAPADGKTAKRASTSKKTVAAKATTTKASAAKPKQGKSTKAASRNGKSQQDDKAMSIHEVAVPSASTKISKRNGHRNGHSNGNGKDNGHEHANGNSNGNGHAETADSNEMVVIYDSNAQAKG